MKITETNVCLLIIPLVFSPPFKIWNHLFSHFICIYFLWEKIFVKFNKMKKKTVDQIRGETKRGGGENFFNALPPPPRKI